jgi:putative flavoprotein involved in K+ transport
VAWLSDMGTYTKGIAEFADAEAVRHKTNHYVTGRDGGRDIDLRRFALEGMKLHGRLNRIDPDALHFGPELRANLDGADAVAEGIKDSIDAWIESRGIDAPAEERRAPVWAPGPEAEDPAELDLAGISAVVWSTGFGRDDRWIELPVFDGRGHPTHDRGVTGRRGLYFLGLPWQHTWGSGRFAGVAADAEYLLDRIVEVGRAVSDGFERLADTPTSTFPEAARRETGPADEDWQTPRTVA